MIAEAMQERAPMMYARLTRSGELDAWITSRAEQAEATFDEAFSRMSDREVREMNQALKDDPGMGAARYQTMRENRLAEQILAETLEFPASGTTTEPRMDR
jgi:hypothetical protein